MGRFLYHFLLVALTCKAVVSAQEQCPPSGVVYLPHPDCTKYVTCDEGTAFQMDCPPNLYYNPQIEQCDFPDNVPECVGGTRPPVGGSPTVPPTTTESTGPSTTTEYSSTTAKPETTTVGPSTTTPTPEPGVLYQCGDTIQAASGRIDYKLNEYYDTGELCSFIVRTPNNSAILFSLESHGINETDQNAVNIFTFNTAGIIDRAHLGPPNPVNEVYLQGALAVVVFRTPPGFQNGGTGFRLHFEGVGPTAYLDGSEYVFSNVSTPGNLTVSQKLGGGTTTAIVLSNDNKVGQGESIRLTLTEDSMALWCNDWFHTYTFVSTNVDYKGKFCNELSDRGVYETEGIIIVIFYKWYDTSYATGDLAWRVVPS